MSEGQAIVKLRKLHNAQTHIINTAKRFNVLKCGRRFGKSALAEELVFEPALQGYPSAYYAPTYKDLSEFWYTIKQIVHELITHKDEQLKQLRLVTGGVIDMWSLDDPDSGRGRKYKRVVIDECEKAKKLEEAWKGSIRATLTDFQGDAWFLSTPKFGDTFFKKIYTFALDPKYNHEWQSWKFSTYDNPHISKDEIDSAAKTLDDLYFRCEYLADDVELNSMLWAFAFDKEKHVGEPEWDERHTTYLSFDFNKNPITCLSIQHYDQEVKVLEAIKLNNSDIYALCDYIMAMYPNAMYMVTGDATGKNTSAMVRDNLNYYRIIKSKLGIGDQQIRVPGVNPRLEENQVLVNSILARYKVSIHKEKAKGLIYDLQNVKMLPDGTIQKANRDDPSQQADLLDCFVADTIIKTANGDKRICDIEIGDNVLTTNGYKPVIDKWDSIADVYEFTMSNGDKIRCTKGHKFYVNNFGWLPILGIFTQNLELCKLDLMETHSANIQSKIISTQLKMAKKYHCIERFGNIILGLFKKAITYTIKMVINLTMTLQISNVLKAKSIYQFTGKIITKKIRKGLLNWLKLGVNMQKNGTHQKRVLNGTNGTQRIFHSVNSTMELISANSAGVNIQGEQKRQGSAQINVKVHGEEKITQTQRPQRAKLVEKNLTHLNISQINTVQGNANQPLILKAIIPVKMEYIGKERVYDITVEEQHEFFANGYLAHNCMRYYLNVFMPNFIRTIQN